MPIRYESDLAGTLNASFSVGNGTLLDAGLTVPTQLANPGGATTYWVDNLGQPRFGAFTLATTSGAVTSITGTPDQVIASSPTGAVTLSLPQSIATTSSPTFASEALTATTASTSTTTGALTVAGGVGVGGALWGGTYLAVGAGAVAPAAGGIYLSRSTGNECFVVFQEQGTSRAQLRGQTTSDGLKITNGAATVTWAQVAGTALSSTVFAINGTTTSTSTTTGALTVAGGFGVGGAVYAGSTLQLASTSTGNGRALVYTRTGSNAVVARFNDSNELGGLYVAGSGQIFFGTNITIATNPQYSRGVIPTARWGNPSGSATYAWYLDVAAAGTANTDITFSTVIRAKADATTVEFTQTTASTSTTTGAVTVAGGVGIAGDLYVGTVTGTATLYAGLDGNGKLIATSVAPGTASLTSTFVGYGSGSNLLTGEASFTFNATTDTLTVPNAAFNGGTASTSTTTGSVVVTGGVGVSGAMNLGSTVTGSGAALWKNNGSIRATNAADTKYLQIGHDDTNAVFVWQTGGFSIRSAALATNIITLTESGTLASGTVAIAYTQASTSTSTGAMTIAGGLGVAGDIYSANHVATGLTATSMRVRTNASQAVTSSGTSVLESYIFTSYNTNVGNVLSIGGQNEDCVNNSVVYRYVFSLAGTAAAGQTLTLSSVARLGAVSSLLSVAPAGDLSLASTTVSTSTTTGALVVAGGAGIGGVINVGSTSAGTAITATAGTTAATLQVSDAGTTNTPDLVNFTHLSSAVPAAGFGGSIHVRAHSSTNTIRTQFTIQSTWVVATDASRTSRTTLQAYDTTNRECIRLEASGSAAMIGFLGATAIVRPSSTTDLRTALINLGLYTTGGASPLNLNGGAFTTTGTAATGVLTTTLSTANTTTPGTVANFRANSTGTAAAGFGGVTLFAAESSTTNDTTMADVTWTWVVATHASRTARVVHNVYDTAAREAFRIQASGTAPMIGFLGASAVVRPAATDDLRQALINLGLYTTGGATPLDLNGGTLTANAVVVRGSAAIGAITVTTASETAPQSITTWNATRHVLLAGVGTTTTSPALAVSYDQTAGASDLISLQPGTAWLPLRVRSSEMSVFLGGSTTSAFTVNSTAVSVPASTASTSTTTGALVVTGGLGIGGALNVGGAIGAAAGAVGTPSITFTGDPNTGFYSFGADQLGITAGGTLMAYYRWDGANYSFSYGRAAGTSGEFFYLHDNGGGEIKLGNSSDTDTLGPLFNFRRSRGTFASPTQISAGDRLATITLSARTDSGYGSQNIFRAEAGEAWVNGGGQSTRLLFYTTPVGSSTATQRLTITENGNIVPGTAALATNATDGFLYITTSAGAPTGVPTAYTGRVAIHYDTTNNRLYVYNGAWRSVVLA